MKNVIISLRDLKNAKEFVSNIESYNSQNVGIVIENNDFDCVKYLIKHSQEIKNCVSVINFGVSNEILPKKDFEVLYALYKTFPNTKCNICVNYGYIDDERFMNEKGSIAWDIQSIINANTSINSVCDFIKNNKLSPFEAFAYIHQFVSTIAKYNELNRKREWLKRKINNKEQYCEGISCVREILMDLGFDTEIK